MAQIITALISFASAVIVASIGAHAKKMDAKAEQREKRREKESLLSMTMMDATLQLSIVSANALTTGHNNGNVEEAREAAKKAKEEYEQFLREVAAQSIRYSIS